MSMPLPTTKDTHLVIAVWTTSHIADLGPFKPSTASSPGAIPPVLCRSGILPFFCSKYGQDVVWKLYDDLLPWNLLKAASGRPEVLVLHGGLDELDETF